MPRTPHRPQNASLSPSAQSMSPPPQSRYSCRPCRQRKVRCSRQIPCVECARLGVECEQAPRKPYSKRERLLEYTEPQTPEQRTAPIVERPALTSTPAATPAATLVASNPQTRNADRRSQEGAPAFGQSLWTGLQEGVFREPRAIETPLARDHSASAPANASRNELGDTLFGGLLGLGSTSIDLSSAHPQPVHAFVLWQTYLQSVNPLSKIIYTPQVQDLVIQATSDYESLAASDVALLFAIYAAAVSALSDESCRSKLGEPKKSLLERYLACSLQALAATGFLKSASLVLLQAFTVFLLAARQTYDINSMWILTGMAVRMGQRLLSLAPGTTNSEFFEKQMRLRVWWQILLVDGRMSQLAGQARTFTSDIPEQPLPANLNDSDINPRMTGAPPPILDRPTEMVFCLLRYEMGHFLISKGKALHDQSATIAQRDAVIDDVANTFQTKFLQHLDPAIPLHQIAAAGAHAAVNKMRLMVHHPGQYPDKGKSMSQEEHDMLFRTSVTMVKVLVDGFTAAHLEHFRWHIEVYFQLDAVVFMLIESQTQPPDSALVDSAWGLVGSVLEHKRHLVQDSDELGKAVRQLVLRSWEARERQARKHAIAITWAAPKAVAEILSEARQPQSGSEALPTPSASATESTATPALGTALDGLDMPPSFSYPSATQALDESSFPSYADLDVLGWETTDWDSWDNWNHLIQSQV
ncbi:fungal specific transcription factor domain protein [Ophiostoma piceae UAMH 11346]|uniref:Fungal specific transcription factor domain protein n=1 Tax=Ophiostoma piceae (strain UAMH 11346) TaxID=1262450 RepID=S3CVN8_OPHP1|nr:fungal specific transcription factor domain protein [Ophiostoma piceae UAMH 11346]